MLNQRGISLIETMICIAMITASVFGASTAIVNAVNQTSDDRHRWNATEQGSYVLDQLTNSYIANGLLDQGDHHLYFDQQFAAATAANNFYDVEWFVKQDTPIAGVYDIQLWVHWKERGDARLVSFETYR